MKKNSAIKIEIPAWKSNIVDLKDDLRSNRREYINPNKKKVRGWKKRVKHVDDWGNAIFDPYLKNWDSPRDFIYEDYRMPPWYTFYGIRRPPLWFFKEIIMQLVASYDNWDEILRERNKPYDLELRIHDSNYITSKIRSGRTEEFGQQINHWPLADEEKPFPIKKFGSKEYDLTLFDWQLCIEEDFMFEEEIEWRGRTLKGLLNEGYIKRENSHGVYYAKQTGDVWVGRKLTKQDAVHRSVISKLPTAPPA